MTDLHQEIADLEAEIDDLSDAAERCRKIMVIARGAIAAGLILLAAAALGLVYPDPMALIVAITAILAGIGIFGSNRSTLQELTDRIRACELRRTLMIDGIDLRSVQDG